MCAVVRIPIYKLSLSRTVVVVRLDVILGGDVRIFIVSPAWDVEFGSQLLYDIRWQSNRYLSWCREGARSIVKQSCSRCEVISVERDDKNLLWMWHV